jgi:hypothetical protein
MVRADLTDHIIQLKEVGIKLKKNVTWAEMGRVKLYGFCCDSFIP